VEPGVAVDSALGGGDQRAGRANEEGAQLPAPKADGARGAGTGSVAVGTQANLDVLRAAALKGVKEATPGGGLSLVSKSLPKGGWGSVLPRLGKGVAAKCEGKATSSSRAARDIPVAMSEMAMGSTPPLPSENPTAGVPPRQVNILGGSAKGSSGSSSPVFPC